MIRAYLPSIYYFEGAEAFDLHVLKKNNPYKGDRAKTWNDGWSSRRSEIIQPETRKRVEEYRHRLATYHLGYNHYPQNIENYSGENLEHWLLGYCTALRDSRLKLEPEYGKFNKEMSK